MDPSASHSTRGALPQHWGAGVQPREGRDAGASGWDPCFPGKVGGCNTRASVWGLAEMRASQGARPRARIPAWYCAEWAGGCGPAGRVGQAEEPAARRSARPGRLAPLPQRAPGYALGARRKSHLDLQHNHHHVLPSGDDAAPVTSAVFKLYASSSTLTGATAFTVRHGFQ